ncbi:MAG TPA: TetR/AcrR family transcriptional regulator [Solirubrobacteraceae bacterium]|nr:TetR/AcrR family transcriptional regulator [Solirubrobacteraceae bacterium]
MLDAMVLVVYERGFSHTTLTAVCARARVGRSTFYEAFADLRACFLAVIDDGYRHASVLIAEAFEREDCWREGVRAALTSLLAFFDSEPRVARVWLVETLAAGAWALERRERHLAALTRAIAAHWTPAEPAQLHPLVATGVMESVLGVLRTHLLTGRDEPLMTLLGPLMGLITTPFLGAEAAAREIELGDRLARAAVHSECPRRSPDADGEDGQSVPIPSLLRDARAHRARECLRHLAEHPGASNRQLADAVGILRDTHISTLLARLHRVGVLTKRPGRPGTANAWSLSPLGMQVLAALQTDTTIRLHATNGRLTDRPTSRHHPSNSNTRDERM